MPRLTKATLEEVNPTGNPVSIPVQFNPTSLRLQLGNKTEGGEQPGRQARQYIGTGSTTLSLELVYDTADEGTTGLPRSVLEYTTLLEHFITPKSDGKKTVAPPRARFTWSEFSITGVVESLQVELDHFAHDGTPLRAKASLSIKAQNADYQLLEVGPGANQAPQPAAPGQPKAGAAPGASNNPFSNALNGLANNPVTDALGKGQAALAQAQGAVARALSGESLSQLAQRAGLDPAAWRGLANGLANPLSLKGGAAVSLGGGSIPLPGASTPSRGGPQAGTAATPAAQAGLDPAATPARDAAGALAQGYALSAAAGVGPAIETIKAGAAAASAQDARLAFTGTPASPAGQTATGPVLTASGRPNPAATRADPRAITFGAGVPLRARRRTAADDRAEALNGSGRAPRGSGGMPPMTSDATQPGWLALAARPYAARGRPGSASQGCGCGCGGRRVGHA